MSDPRFNSCHLEWPRRHAYRDAREGVLGARGPVTCAAEWADYVAPPFVGRPEAGYVLVHHPGGVCFPLRVGLTAIGRYPENDIVLKPIEVSRRHCVVLVHANGGCEVYDTASRNGTRVNGRAVRHVWLNPGDVLQIADNRFVLTRNGDTSVGCDDEATG